MLPEPLDSFSQGLLDEERQVGPIVDVAARARLFARLDLAMAAVPVAASVAPAVAHVAAGSLKLGLTMLATGALLGSGVTAVLMPRKTVIVERVVVQKQPPVVDLVPVIATPSVVVAVGPKPRPPRVTPKVMPPASTLVAEQALLEMVRSALLSRRFDEALATLDRYSREFSQGALSEEHDALEVQALSLGEHPDQARARARAFRQRYPDSIFLPAVDAVSPP